MQRLHNVLFVTHDYRVCVKKYPSRNNVYTMYLMWLYFKSFSDLCMGIQ